MTAAGVNYLYDGDGRRVTKLNGSGQPTKVYWYGSGGSILAETNSSGAVTAEYAFFGGQRIAMLPSSGSAQYYVEDMLGSSRIVATNTGVVCYDADFYPYGGERTVTDNCPASNKYKFEGKERDDESGNDDFGARYYSWRFGRWLSADWSAVPEPVPYANLTNPQTLNLYAMVSDNPETFADLDGHADSNNLCPSNGNCDSHDEQKTLNSKKVGAANLCAETSGCTQTTDKNGITTVTVKSNDAQVTPNPDGSITMTSTSTTQTYKFNQKGQMIDGHQETVGESLTIGARATTSQPINASRDLSTRDAMHQFGIQYVDMFQRGFEDTRGTLARYPGVQAADVRAHPGRYALKGVEVGALFTPGGAYELPKVIIEVGVASVELARELAHAH